MSWSPQEIGAHGKERATAVNKDAGTVLEKAQRTEPKTNEWTALPLSVKGWEREWIGTTGKLGVEAHTRNPRPGRRQQENLDLRSAGAI